MVHATAQADTASQVAETLFQEGKAAYGRGEYPAACDKFRASQRAEAAVGTLAALAACEEKQGRLASAADALRRGAELARERKDAEREQVLRKKLDELEPQVPSLRVESRGDASDVTLDGVPLAAGAFGVPLPLDPGLHRLVFQAGGRRQEKRVALKAGTGVTIVTLDSGASSLEGGEASPAPAAQTSGSARVPLAIGLWGLGALGLGLGAYFGLRTFGHASDVERACPSPQRCPDIAAARVAFADGESSAALSQVFFVGGALAGAAGTLLWFLWPTHTAASDAPAARRTPMWKHVSVTPMRDGAHAGLTGTFQ